MKHLRLYVVFVTLMMCLMVTSCSCSSKVETMELSLSDLQAADGSFLMPNTHWGDGIADTEASLGYVFPTMPYWSQEVYAGITDEKELKDYRNTDDYDSVEYTAYKNGNPILVSYGEYRAHFTCEFYAGALRVVSFYFGSETDSRDPKMDYGGVQNDYEAVRNQLVTDLTALYGEPELKEAKGANPSYVWEQNGTRLTVTQKPNGHEEIVLAVHKLKE